MSVLISCPRCGSRPLEEFLYGEILSPPAELEDEQRDLDRSYFHDNLEGEVEERWFHAMGCRRWCTAVRDTRDNRIVRVLETADSAEPEA